VLTQDPDWAAWSEENSRRMLNAICWRLNPIIYAEVSAHFSTIEELDEALSPEDFQRLPLPYELEFLAARLFPAVSPPRRPEACANARFLHRCGMLLPTG